MKPVEHNIIIRRGIDFEFEVFSQVKNYLYDPAVNTDPADLKRTHAENLEEYGFNYTYIDFLATYTIAELVIRKPWLKAGDSTSVPLLTLSLANAEIVLTDKTVKVTMVAADTQNIDFNKGTYRLHLKTAAGKVDVLVYGKVTVLGEKA